MMWTDLHGGTLSQMKKCISTENPEGGGSIDNMACFDVVESTTQPVNAIES
jgi:hypothetical protein